ncbi:MAG TPA: lytic murein transglycosylase [Candidatus Binatia bacterium]|nr:lytic murein transglycosylase [Candidatus Binatia bacterium]
MRPLALAAVLALAAGVAQAGGEPVDNVDYAQHAKTPALLDLLRKDYGFTDADLAQVVTALHGARRIPRLIETEQTSKEKTLSWDAYRAIHVTAGNVKAGAKFMAEQRKWLARAEAEYGVAPAAVAAILGVETKFGAYASPHRALDALATQGFDHPTRSDFFFRELAEFFALCRESHLKADQVRGSYAGAIGAAQFMPSNYRRLAVDFDGDGIKDLWQPPDAIGSIANYLVRYAPERAWQRGAPLTVPARLKHEPKDDWVRNTRQLTHTAGDFYKVGLSTEVPLPTPTPVGLLDLSLADGRHEYWLALNNFYSVMSYNPRVYYAMAVAELMRELQQADAR